MKAAIKKIVTGENLSEEEAEYALEIIMSGQATQAQIGAFLAGLRLKGETLEEITACARVMRRFCKTINPRVNGRLVDTCGTGGDLIKTFNVSTISALVAVGAGVPIAKHGNRSVTSRCGSADLLEGLGVKIDADPEAVERCIEEVGIGFIFAPIFHPAMKHVLGPRRELGIRTIFNILGPLTNPANAEAQLMGVFSPDLTEKMAGALGRLGVVKAYVVHGLDGIDEISITGKTKVSELEDGAVKTYIVKPEDFGMRSVEPKQILGGNREDNIQIALEVLQGLNGPRRDMVILNAAAAIAAGGRADDIGEGIEMARSSIEAGEALKKLRDLVRVSGGDIASLERLLEGWR